MIHMMNANTFTGAAYHLTGDVSADEFADALKEGILAKQWICGMPDTLVVINVDGQYVIAAYGADDLVETSRITRSLPWTEPRQSLTPRW